MAHVYPHFIRRHGNSMGPGLESNASAILNILWSIYQRSSSKQVQVLHKYSDACAAFIWKRNRHL